MFTQLFAFCVLWATVAGARADELEVVRVMTLNLWHGGEAGGQPLSQTIALIHASKADIVGLQETHAHAKDGERPRDNGRKLGEMLGWSYFDQGDRTGILSRFPILTNTPSKWGVSVRLPSGREVWLFNAHLMHAPYQPYQLLGIPYANAPFIQTASDAVSEARKARGAQVDRLLGELKPILALGEPVFLTGDFNEPSHQDWTLRAAAAGLCPLPVEYPSTHAITDAGLRDAYRTVFSDEVLHRGRTWTPTTRADDPKDRHDRIDFVFYAGRGVGVTQCAIVGESKEYADVVVWPYPSDHRAVVATLELENRSNQPVPRKTVKLPKLTPGK